MASMEMVGEMELLTRKRNHLKEENSSRVRRITSMIGRILFHWKI
jgi:FtsZ-binding cell division protein ZapB